MLDDIEQVPLAPELEPSKSVGEEVDITELLDRSKISFKELLAFIAWLHLHLLGTSLDAPVRPLITLLMNCEWS